MRSKHRIRLVLATAWLACGVAMAITHEIDGMLPDGGDCPSFGTWFGSTRTCVIDDATIEDGQWLRIESATVRVAGNLTNEGLLDNHGLLVVDGFLNSTNDLVNSWDGSMTVHGRFFSHFMYNFGGLVAGPGAEIEFELHLENNAPLRNHGHVTLTGNLFNIPERTIENLGQISIAATGMLANSGRFLHAGHIDNQGALQNDAELIEHCDSTMSGNPITGASPVQAQSLQVAPHLITWCSIDGASGYDVATGDVALLVANGDFSTATGGCLGNDLTGLSLEHATVPQPGEGLWILVRANGVPASGFDSAFSSQVGEREPGIDASPAGCP